ncbi:MAG: DUF952 domain-containing protein [Pseudomonadota bacterium]
MNTCSNGPPDRAARLLHITSQAAWHAAGTLYRAASLDSEGFIHCSTVDQVLVPANERFHGHSGLLLLVIAREAIDADVVFEDCYASGMAFPHVYGPIPRAAVLDAVAFPPGADGRFTLPAALAPWFDRAD